MVKKLSIIREIFKGDHNVALAVAAVRKLKKNKLDLCIAEPMQICIHWKDNSPKPVNHRLTLKEEPKFKSDI